MNWIERAVLLLLLGNAVGSLIADVQQKHEMRIHKLEDAAALQFCAYQKLAEKVEGKP